jgi:hypothetical protein
MSATHLTIHAGICGFVTEVDAASDDEQMVSLTIATPCPNIARLITHLPPTLDAYEEIGLGFDGAIPQAARAELKGCCTGCVVPSGLFKAMQVAAAVALPQEISLRFS